jgi:hypothetical protein
MKREILSMMRASLKMAILEDEPVADKKMYAKSCHYFILSCGC